MKVRTAILGVAGLCVVLAGAAAATLAVANWSDDPLSPEAQNLLAVPAATVPDASNAYFVLLGMSAPKEQDALEAGMKYQAVLEKEFKEKPQRNAFSDMPSMPDDLAAWNKLRCPLQGTDCVDFYLRNKDGLQGALKDNDVLFRRYNQALQMPGLEERILLSVAAPFPKYALFNRAAELRLIADVYTIDGGNVAGGVASLTRKIAADRKLLAASRSLIFKMVSTGVLRRDYEVLSEIIEHWPQVLESNRDDLAGVLKPLDANESDMRKALGTENLFSANMMMHLAQTVEAMGSVVTTGAAGSPSNRGEQLMVKCCYLPQASLNMMAPVWTLRAEGGVGDLSKIDERKQKLADAQLALAESVRGPFNKVRNPLGKILLGLNDADYFAYIERVYDLDGYIRLVALQAAIKRDKVGADKVAAYVAQAAPELRNPYNGKPMLWDAVNSTLVYEGRQDATANPPAAKKKHSIKIKPA